MDNRYRLIGINICGDVIPALELEWVTIDRNPAIWILNAVSIIQNNRIKTIDGIFKGEIPKNETRPIIVGENLKKYNYTDSIVSVCDLGQTLTIEEFNDIHGNR